METIALIKDLLTIVVLVGGGFMAFVAMQRKLDVVVVKQTSMEQDLTQIGAEIKEDVKDLSEVVTLQGRHDERITALSMTVVNQGKRLDDAIRRMNTFVDMKLGDALHRLDGDEEN